jgi:hypothetical protein
VETFIEAIQGLVICRSQVAAQEPVAPRSGNGAVEDDVAVRVSQQLEVGQVFDPVGQPARLADALLNQGRVTVPSEDVQPGVQEQGGGGARPLQRASAEVGRTGPGKVVRLLLDRASGVRVAQQE